MQRVIREKFSSHTIIAVAHKLDTILDFDKVVMLDAGQVVEFDDPYALLNTDSAFNKLYNSAMEEHANNEVQVEDDITTTTGSQASARDPRVTSLPASSAASTSLNPSSGGRD